MDDIINVNYTDIVDSYVISPYNYKHHSDVEDIEQLEFMAVFSASDNVQSGDVACVTLSVVADDILEPPVDFLVRFDITPLVNEPQDAPDFTRVRVIDTTAQGRTSSIFLELPPPHTHIQIFTINFMSV